MKTTFAPLRALAPVVLIASLGLAACTPANRSGPVLDKMEVLARQDWWDNRDFDWYAANAPFFESPDPDIDQTYWYRWEVLTKHLTYGSPETGYTFTEFIDRPFWSGTYGAISCPLGHQHYEVRWMKDRRVIEDFARYWFETPGAQPRSYSNWYGDAMWATYLVTGDRDFLRTVYPHMLTQYQGWMDERWDAEHRMFNWDGMHDGMETNIASRQTAQPFDGAPGYRPTLNSYLFADARAIARTAALLGETDVAEDFATRSAELKQRVQDELWDPRREFFFQQFSRDEKDGIKAKTLTHETGLYAGSEYGREEIGFVPWQFHLPDPGYESAWHSLLDSTKFATPFGPPTTEINDPMFWVSPRCCEWSGNQWPYATSQTLTAMANLVHDYDQDVITKEAYVAQLRTYARLHRKDGRPYIAEAADPFTGSWDGHDSYYHSEHYLHSGYIDQVITGLVGLRPREDDVIEVNPLVPDDWPYFALDDVAYRGHMLSILWDRDGSRYHRGAGLSILLDGDVVANRSDLGRLEAPFDMTPLPPVERMHNYAVNNDGTAFPLLTASYSAPDRPPFWAQDGHIWYHESPPNRWTTAGSPNETDWIEIDFGTERPVWTLMLYFVDEPEGLAAPASFTIKAWLGEGWAEIEGARWPETPTPGRANAVDLGGHAYSRLRVEFEHAAGARTGLSEIEAWGDGPLPLSQPTAASPNLALNTHGEGYPRASASYTSPYDRVEQVNDGRIAFSRYSRNRWTAFDSPNATDWVAIEFGEAVTVGAVDLYLWGDERGVAAPTSIRIEALVGDRWSPVTETGRNLAAPATWSLNRVTFLPVEASAVRAVFEHDEPAFSGVTEMRVWGPEL